ncbi:unnamed protein product [Sphagnum compactum]
MAITATGASSLLLSCLSWLLLGWLFAIVSQMTSASALLQPLSDADKEAAAAYFLADANGFYGSLWETYHAEQALEILEWVDVEAHKICDSLVGVYNNPLTLWKMPFMV